MYWLIIAGEQITPKLSSWKPQTFTIENSCWESGPEERLRWVILALGLSGGCRQDVTQDYNIWRQDWGWRVHSQDGVHTWLLAGGLSSWPCDPLHSLTAQVFSPHGSGLFLDWVIPERKVKAAMSFMTWQPRQSHSIVSTTGEKQVTKYSPHSRQVELGSTEQRGSKEFVDIV